MANTTEEPGFWKEDFAVRAYDVDFTGHAHAGALCHYFLDAAWNHAEALDFGYTHLAQKNCFWVLARLRIQITTVPRWGDLAQLITWPRKARGILALRDFEIVDPSGQQLLGGSSAWLVLDQANRKPQRIENWLGSLGAFPERMAIGIDPCKLAPVASNTAVMTLTARYGDIDVNGHVNSARYLTWLLDSFNLQFHREHNLSLIELNYVGETKGDETLSISSAENAAGRWSHSIVKSDGTEACRARTEWVKAAGPLAQPTAKAAT